MATVIDSLVVELGLDASKFTLQQREALESAKRLEAEQTKAAKNIEYGAGRAGTALAGVRTQALQMLAVLTGGTGLVAFGLNMTNANAQLGRLERNLGQSAATISKWQGVARLFGGDAQTMAQSFTSISDAFAGWKIGMVSPLIADLRAISTAGGKVIDVNKGVEQSYMDLAENLRAIHARDPAQAGLLGRKIGLDPALYDAMISGNLQKVLDLVTRIGVATTADTDAFGELEKRISLMGLKAEQIGRNVLGGEGGGASSIIRLSDWLNKPWREALSEAGYYLSNQGQRDAMASGVTKPSERFQPLLPAAGTGGAFLSQAEKEQFIRSEAAKRRINPNVAMAVARAEGFNSFVSSIPGETSYGAFQLNVSPGGRKGHLGDQFQKDTGLDPSDPKNERATILYALDHTTKDGWRAFHGAKNTGIDRWAGVDRSAGAVGSSTEVHIGTVNVQPPASAEPSAWAASFADAVKKQSYAAQANTGAQ